MGPLSFRSRFSLGVKWDAVFFQVNSQWRAIVQIHDFPIGSTPPNTLNRNESSTLIRSSLKSPSKSQHLTHTTRVVLSGVRWKPVGQSIGDPDSPGTLLPQFPRTILSLQLFNSTRLFPAARGVSRAAPPHARRGAGSSSTGRLWSSRRIKPTPIWDGKTQKPM